MIKKFEIDAVHKALGEFVIVFQWIENLYRQIGWFILDPEKRQWPPMQLRRETNSGLINKVTELYVEFTNTYSFANGADKVRDMVELRDHFHDFRHYRNSLLHSTYIELMTGREVNGYIRSNPVIGVDPETGDLIYDQEEFSAEVIHSKLREYGDLTMRLNIAHLQFIHWFPFEQHGKAA